MDLTQSRLTKKEWESIEVPVSVEEQGVGKLLMEGARQPLVRRNRAISLGSYLQIEKSPATADYFWTKYLLPELQRGKGGCATSAPTAHGFGAWVKPAKAPGLKSADRIRLRNADRSLACPDKRANIFEFVLIALVQDLYHARVHGGGCAWLTPYYALRALRDRAVAGLHERLIEEISALVERLDGEVRAEDLVLNASTVIEQNRALLEHADEQLFDHQRRLLEAAGEVGGPPRLILLTAPTGTGKTVTPVGLAERKRVIFVCAARHVGLALAKLAVSLQKKVAFAFGCDSEEDIRLHYYAATDCVRSRRSGQIVKVDNSAGAEVEIMICDVRSCPLATSYMARFNHPESMVLYWDEPTIALDYADHPCHPIIHRAWTSNVIPRVVLSSATLPTVEELGPTTSDFLERFPGAEVTVIESHECRKSIPLLARNGSVVAPHDLGTAKHGGTAGQAGSAARRALKNKTLFRHIGLAEACGFIRAFHAAHPDTNCLSTRFRTPGDITAESVKAYYLECVASAASRCGQDEFEQICLASNASRPRSTVRVMTSDAHTLTDGPTIYLADDVDRIARFFIKDAGLPTDVLDRLGKCIAQNEALRAKMDVMQRAYDDGTKKDEGKGRERRMAAGKVDPGMVRLAKNIDALRGLLRPASIAPVHIPNMHEHLKQHAPPEVTGSFAPDINEAEVEEVMLVEGVDDKWRLLLLLGVGVFAPWNSASYTEIMKKLAQEQKLFLVVATSDYIYGTNYQFCHGYIAKDLGNMTQEKCVQAMGRVGRNRLQQTYSIRFRDDALIRRLYSIEIDRPEVANMARLFAA
tara:strand:- start:2738 stop:5170 length:2433 start_codon:yes stop_codon:yes gene_type:complete